MKWSWNLFWSDRAEWTLRLVLLAFISAVGAAMSSASAELPAPTARPAPVDLDRFYSVDLRDLAQYTATSFPEARSILHSMSRYPRSYFPEGVRFSQDGVGIPAQVKCAANSRKRGKHPHLVDSVYGVEVSDPPILRADGLLEVPIVAMIHSKKAAKSAPSSNGLFFRKMRVWISESDLRISNVVIEKDIPISDTRFELRVSLIDRKATLVDSVHGIRKVYPLGVGAFDEGVITPGKTVLMTPTFTNAELRPEFAIFARDDHDYYCGMPFLRVTRGGRGSAGWTAIGFHISQHAELLRGFDSHGCMRLREKDLYELYFILLNQGEPSIRLNVALESTAPGDHPFPLTQNRYQRVVDCKNPTRPALGCAKAYASWERRFGSRALPPQSCREKTS